MGPQLEHEEYCATIRREAIGLTRHLDGASLTTDVPTCPGWNLAQLTTHVGEELRWLDGMVRSRATAMADDTAMRDLSPVPGRTAEEAGAWIVAGAESCVRALREAGPDAAMWTPMPGRTASVLARRFAHEGLIHRIDAALALGLPVEIEPGAAADALAEWMELGALPVMFEFHPERRALLGPGRTMRFTATDAPGVSWLVDNRGELMVHRPAEPDEAAAVVVSGPLTPLLLFLYHRGGDDDLVVTGDRVLLDEWLPGQGFG